MSIIRVQGTTNPPVWLNDPFLIVGRRVYYLNTGNMVSNPDVASRVLAEIDAIPDPAAAATAIWGWLSHHISKGYFELEDSDDSSNALRVKVKGKRYLLNVVVDDPIGDEEF